MFSIHKKRLVRAAVIIASTLCFLPPAISASPIHHPAKIKHTRHVAAKTHHLHSRHQLVQAKKTLPAGVPVINSEAPAAVPSGVEFVVNANNSIVSKNVIIPAALNTAVEDEAGVEILTQTSSESPASYQAKAEQAKELNAVEEVKEQLAAKPAVIMQATPQLASAAPRGVFQFESEQSSVAPTVKPQSAASASPPVVVISEPPRSFFHFKQDEKPAATQTTVAQAQPAAQSAAPQPTAAERLQGFLSLFHRPPSAPAAPTETKPPLTQANAVQSSPQETKPAPAPVQVAETKPQAPAEEISPGPVRRFFQFHRNSAEPATVAVTVVPAPQASTHVLGGLAASMHKHIVDFVKNTVSTLRYSDYKLGGSKFDTSKGIYIVDCSNFVDQILKQVSPHAYTHLVNATGAVTPVTQHYYKFFKELAYNSDDYWNKVTNVEQLRAGDILVFRNKQTHGRSAGGHVMVVMDKPTINSGVYFVRVADSAPARHSEDTRQRNEAGIGIGTLLLKATKSGRPFAYAWGEGAYWNKKVNFAMARPTEWN